jgi:hypothetical protein
MKDSAEQRARDMLERMGVPDAQSFTTGDVIELANLIAQRDGLVRACEMLLDRTANPVEDHAFYTLADARKAARDAIAYQKS